MLPNIAGEFGICQPPELRFGTDGKPWAKLRGVAKDRKYNTSTSEWEDGEACYVDIVIGGKVAESLIESVGVGDCILVSGTLNQREWESSDGKKQKAYSIRAKEIAVSLRYGPVPTAKIRNEQGNAPAQTNNSTPSAEESPF
jgi:single-strand DNA-binding protein